MVYCVAQLDLEIFWGTLGSAYPNTFLRLGRHVSVIVTIS
jgi:hypothetical protein